MELSICCFSDTHTMHERVKLPPCDIALFAGDMTSRGERDQLEDFLAWYATQNQCTYKVFIAGNHDICFDPRFNGETGADKWMGEMMEQFRVNDEAGDLFYLQDSGVTLMGARIWGSPVTPWFHGEYWAFNRHRGAGIRPVWAAIPEEADIILTHGPVYGLHDYTRSGEYVGCEELMMRVNALDPKLHVCGHIHEGYGIATQKETVFANASVCNSMYHPVNQPHLIKINV